MSSASVTSPTSPVPQRDIRSASRPFKRDKDHGSKWSMGMRPSAGVRISYNNLTVEDSDGLVGGSSSQREKVRPHKQWSQMTSDYKSHANKTPKPTAHASWTAGNASGRVVRKVDAQLEAQSNSRSDLSRSLLDLLPQHNQKSSSSIQTAIRASGDEGILYSFDSKGKSPGQKGREVDLGGLVEMAEQKFLNEQTERMIKEDYEVLDADGESVVLASGKGKRKGSPKNNAVKTEVKVEDDDDGFELI